ncbi:MAG: hypothetical protein ACE148_05610 [Vicinamibacterales bacterium]
MRLLPAAIAAALLGALAGAIWLIVAYSYNPAIHLRPDGQRARLVTGFYAREAGPSGEFTWTTDRAKLTLTGLDRRARWTCNARVQAGRPEDVPLPLLTVVADGTTAARRQVGNSWETIAFEVPPQPGGRGLALELVVTPSFVPVTADTRELGVMVDVIECRPAPGSPVLPPPYSSRHAATTAAVLGGAVALAGVTPGSAIGAAVAIAAVQSLPLSTGTAPYSDYPGNSAWLALAVGIALVAGIGIANRSSPRPLRNTARFAAIFTAAVAYFRLLGLMHPDVAAGGVAGCARKVEALLAEEFPALVTAPETLTDGLTLVFVASPFALLAHPATVLLAFAVAADAAAALWLYGMVTRAWGDRLLASATVAIYNLVPLAFDTLASGRLSVAFGQSLAAVAMALVARTSVRLSPAGPFAGLTALLLAAFLANFGTLVVLASASMAAAILYRIRGGPGLQDIAPRLAASVGAAAAVAVVFYLLGSNPPEGGSGPAGPVHGGDPFGFPLLLLATVGAWRAMRTPLTDRLSLTLAAWVLGATGCWVAAALAGLSLPAVLALAPPLSVLAAVGARWMWRGGPVRRMVVIILLAGTVGVATVNWRGWL